VLHMTDCKTCALKRGSASYRQHESRNVLIQT